jgi:hypothetical protein
MSSYRRGRILKSSSQNDFSTGIIKSFTTPTIDTNSEAIIEFNSRPQAIPPVDAVNSSTKIPPGTR